MPTIHIDNQEVTVPDGATIIDTSDMKIPQVTRKLLDHVRALR